MESHGTSGRYSPEVRARAVRMVLEHGGEHGSQWEAISSIAGKMGCAAETLLRWVRQAERDDGLRPGPTSSEQTRMQEIAAIFSSKTAPLLWLSGVSWRHEPDVSRNSETRSH